MRRDSGRGREPVMIGDGECLRETDRAILVQMKGEDRPDTGGFASECEIWIPKSVLHDDSEVYEKGGTGTVIVFAWYAEKEGLDHA
jgi:hypothetical protein